MATSEPLITLATVTRQRFCAQVGLILPKVALEIRDHLSLAAQNARMLKDMQATRDAQLAFEQGDRRWIEGVRAQLQLGARRPGGNAQQSPNKSNAQDLSGALELVADEAVEDQLLSAKLAARVQEESGTALSHLRLRLLFAEGRVELQPNDVVRPESLARIVLDEWIKAGLSRDLWKQLADVMARSAAVKLQTAYEEANRFLVTNGVMPDINLKGAVRKAPPAPEGSAGAQDSRAAPISSRDSVRAPGPDSTAFARTAVMNAPTLQAAGPGGHWWSQARAQTQEVMGRLKKLFVDRVGEGAAPSGAGQPVPPPSPGLQALFDGGALKGFAQVASAMPQEGVVVTNAQMDQFVQLVRQRSAELKQAADTPNEKAVIEVVALMFQSILTEDRIRPSLRVWFARLQIPVLRVALAEPDFFGSLQHPARRLIDRMGSCALGFDGGASNVSAQALETEIKRVVEVIEQYPETGRRVFQLVYDEFQKFLADYLQSQGPATRLVSIAQQVEQKETLAVQYTIELRKQLNDMPVRDDIRDFLFKLWAEVLAVATLKFGPRDETTGTLKKTATDLLWAASAKPTRTERAQVIAKLPDLLARLRKGMSLLNMDTASQDAHIKRISDILADAFMSRTEAIPPAQLAAMTRHLSDLEDFLPEDGVGDLNLDQDSIEMITGADASRIEVITQGGQPPNEAMRAWAMELQLGAWFRLDHNHSNSQVQLAWRSHRGQLCLFTTAQQHCYLIQTARVASYLQAGLLVPAESESLTTRATRAALEKLDANPERLLS